MKIVSTATHTNNTRITIEFYGENGLLSNAEAIAKKHGCGFSHNVKIGPFLGEGVTRKSFGSVSFNKGDHAAALAEFIS